MRKKSIVIIGAVVGILLLLLVVSSIRSNRPFVFEGSEELGKLLAEWTPANAEKTSPHPVAGELIYYSVNYFTNGSNYVGPEEGPRKFLKSNVESVAEAGAVAVLVFDREQYGTYSNGAKAWRIVCKVYLLETDTLKILASGIVEGDDPPSTTSGPERYGSAPRLTTCESYANNLAFKLGL